MHAHMGNSFEKNELHVRHLTSRENILEPSDVRIDSTTFPLNQCPTENGDVANGCRPGKFAECDGAKRHVGFAPLWRHVSIFMSHAARLSRPRQPSIWFELLATITLASIGLILLIALSFTSSSDQRLPALLLSEGDLGSRIYGLCAARALTDTAGL